MRLLVIALFLLVVAGCDKSATAPVAKCQKVGDQCQLPTGPGPLGVCNSRTCQDGETPPCLMCMPQH